MNDETNISSDKEIYSDSTLTSSLDQGKIIHNWISRIVIMTNSPGPEFGVGSFDITFNFLSSNIEEIEFNEQQLSQQPRDDYRQNRQQQIRDCESRRRIRMNSLFEELKVAINPQSVNKTSRVTKEDILVDVSYFKV